jgi:hypothetical protein
VYLPTIHLDRLGRERRAAVSAGKRLTYYDLLTRYMKKEEAQRARVDRAGLKVIRAALYLSRSRNEHHRLKRYLWEIKKRIDAGEILPPLKEKKKKKGRAIEL